jgi:hypothetical protein
MVDAEFRTYKQLVLGEVRAKYFQALAVNKKAQQRYYLLAFGVGAEVNSKHATLDEIIKCSNAELVTRIMMFEARSKYRAAVAEFGKKQSGRRV